MHSGVEAFLNDIPQEEGYKVRIKAKTGNAKM